MLTTDNIVNTCAQTCCDYNKLRILILLLFMHDKDESHPMLAVTIESGSDDYCKNTTVTGVVIHFIPQLIYHNFMSQLFHIKHANPPLFSCVKSCKKT